eukprot:Skav202599  [mRNA]  locus=scaffold2348:84605:86560:+ [translate_table: standard]
MKSNSASEYARSGKQIGCTQALYVSDNFAKSLFTACLSLLRLLTLMGGGEEVWETIQEDDQIHVRRHRDRSLFGGCIFVKMHHVEGNDLLYSVIHARSLAEAEGKEETKGNAREKEGTGRSFTGRSKCGWTDGLERQKRRMLERHSDARTDRQEGTGRTSKDMEGQQEAKSGGLERKEARKRA